MERVARYTSTVVQLSDISGSLAWDLSKFTGKCVMSRDNVLYDVWIFPMLARSNLAVAAGGTVVVAGTRKFRSEYATIEASLWRFRRQKRSSQA